MSFANLLVRRLRGSEIVAVDAHSDRSFARHSHGEFGIGLVTSGAQRSWSGRGAVEAVHGDLITVNPGEVHDGTPVGQARAWSMLYIPAALVGGIVADLTEGRTTNRELHRPVVTDPALARLFIQTRQAALHDDPTLDLDETLFVLLAGLLRMRPELPDATDRRIFHLRQMIDADPAGRHALPAMAAQSGLSRFQTLRAFSRLTGLTPHAYTTQRRLELARRLIGRSTPLAEAAVDAGFADQSHMHRAFVARYGYTPGQYARAYRSASAISYKSPRHLRH